MNLVLVLFIVDFIFVKSDYGLKLNYFLVLDSFFKIIAWIQFEKITRTIAAVSRRVVYGFCFILHSKFTGENSLVNRNFTSNSKFEITRQITVKNDNLFE